jgi:hypothetical protein
VSASLLVSACASSPPPAAAPAAEASAEPAPPPQDPAEESAAPSELHLVQAAANQIASGWFTEKAAKEKVELALKIRVDDMSAVVVGKGDGAFTLTGVEAVNTKPDVVIELSREDADALAEGGASLKSLKAAGKVKSDNDQGLDFFISYMK